MEAQKYTQQRASEIREARSISLERASLASVSEVMEESSCNAIARVKARKDVKGGGLYVNGKRIDDEQHRLTASDLMFGKYVLMRRGKRNYAVVTAG